MESIVLVDVKTSSDHACFPIASAVASCIPYLQTQLSTKVGEKRKHDAAVSISLPVDCTLQAFQAILSRMSSTVSGSDGYCYKQSFRWKIDHAHVAVALVKAADFLLLPALVEEVITQSSHCFRKPEDVAQIEGLSHPAVQELVQLTRGGQLAAAMDVRGIETICQNNLARGGTVAQVASKVVQQWLRREDRTEAEIKQLSKTLFMKFRKSSEVDLETVRIARELALHGKFNMKATLETLPLNYFSSSCVEVCSGLKTVAQIFIEHGLRNSEDMTPIVTAVFHDGDKANIEENAIIKAFYSESFDLFFSGRPLSPQELEALLMKVANRRLHRIFKYSASFVAMVPSLDQELQDIVWKVVKPSAQNISKALLLALSPTVRLKVVVAIMPQFAGCDKDIQDWVAEQMQHGML